jgi:hypothetical protein
VVELGLPHREDEGRGGLELGGDKGALAGGCLWIGTRLLAGWVGIMNVDMATNMR